MLQNTTQNNSTATEPNLSPIEEAYVNHNDIIEEGSEINFLLLHMLTAKINEQDVHILIDSGSTHSIITCEAKEKLNLKSVSTTQLSLVTINGSTNCTSEIISVPLCTEGGIEILAYTLDKTLTTNVNINEENLNVLWPALEESIKTEVLKNQFKERTDIIIGQDNIWRILLKNIVIHPSKEFGVINTFLGWTIGGYIETGSINISRQSPREIKASNFNIILEEEEEEKIHNIEKKLQTFYNIDAEEENDTTNYTYEEVYAVESFLKNIECGKDGRYSVTHS